MPKETISDGLNRCSLGIMEVYLLHTKSGNKALISPCVVNLALPERCGSERSEVGTNKGGSEREAPLVRMLGKMSAQPNRRQPIKERNITSCR